PKEPYPARNVVDSALRIYSFSRITPADLSRYNHRSGCASGKTLVPWRDLRIQGSGASFWSASDKLCRVVHSQRIDDLYSATACRKAGNQDNAASWSMLLPWKQSVLCPALSLGYNFQPCHSHPDKSDDNGDIRLFYHAAARFNVDNPGNPESKPIQQGRACRAPARLSMVCCRDGKEIKKPARLIFRQAGGYTICRKPYKALRSSNLSFITSILLRAFINAFADASIMSVDE